jgi:GGDEF domain-containing protein
MIRLIEPRTSVMVLCALAGVGIAGVASLSEPAAIAIFALAVAATVLGQLRGGIVGGVLGAAIGILLFAGSHAVLTASREDPVFNAFDRTALLASPSLQRGDTWVPVLVAALVLVIVLAAAELASATIAARAEQLRRQEALVDLLSREDPETELASRQFGLQRAEEEIARCRRYHRRVVLALVGLDQPKSPAVDPEQTAKLLRRFGEVIKANQRTMDTTARYSRWEALLVLPETSAEGATIMLTRLTASATEALARPVRASMMVFPEDGQQVAELQKELEEALAACRATGLTLGDSTLLAAGSRNVG